MNFVPRQPKLLIVDDSALIRNRLVRLVSELTRAQVVGEACDAGEATEQFRRWEPDVVILDIQLANGTGIEVLEHIKAVAPACIVIMLTSHNSAEYRERCRRAGADHFFQKATEFEQAVDVVRRLA